MSEFDVWKEMNDRLLAHGSWLYDEDGSRFDFSTFFDPFSEEFLAMPTQRKVLVLKELFYCGVEPILLSSLYRVYCDQYMHDDLYTDFGQALLEILKAVIVEDLYEIDVNDPCNWYRGKDVGTHLESSHEATIMVLEGMMPELHEQIKAQKDPLIRRRLVYFNRTGNSKSIFIVPNEDPILDQIDDELFRRVETFEPDVKLRYGEIRLLAEDIHDELGPEHKKVQSMESRRL